MKIFSKAALVFFVLGFVTTVRATPPEVQMTWGTPQMISGDSDVATDGTLVDAFAFGDNTVTDVTLNGVTFHAVSVPNDGTTPVVAFGSYSLSTTSGPLKSYSTFGSQEAPFGLLSSGYQSLLTQGGSTASPDTLILTLSGLVVGQNYLFQFWTSNSPLMTAGSGNRFSTTAVAGNSISLTDNVTNTDGDVGQFVIGTFTAVSTSQFMAFSGIDGSNDPAINAFQLRALPVPEPSSSVLLGLALLGSSFIFRRRRHSA